jgi:Tfp pilus assembly protein PilN
MTDIAAPAKSKALVGVLSVILIVVAVIAGVFTYKYFQATEENATLTAQLEDSQKQISELQPLAEKARTLPVRLTINRHALNAGYNVVAFVAAFSVHRK